MLRQLEYIEKIKAYDPDLYAELEPMIIDASSGWQTVQADDVK
jgi:hypothetical protein